MRILITGSSGLFGYALRGKLGQTHDLICWSHTETSEPFLPVDLREATAVRAALGRAAPDVVIHAAAYREPDFCEANPEETRALNVEGTQHVLEAAGDVEARMVYISTDYVFDGTSPFYKEDQPPSPINVYGETKAEGEALVRSTADHLILRIPILYGPGARPESDLIAKLRSAVERDKEIVVDDEARRTPTLTTDVAEAVAFLLDLGNVENAIIHYSGPDILSRYAMTLTVGRVLGVSTDHIRPGPAARQKARRPVAALLDSGHIRALGFDIFTTFEDGVRRLLGRHGSGC